MLVSVVVPAYNEERYLGLCLESLVRQRHTGFDVEIIVVDNGSDDRTAEVARSYGVRVVSEPRMGVARARQAGFEAARGMLIASTDADSVPPCDWLERFVASLMKHPDVLGVYGPVSVLDSKPGVESLFIYVSTAFMWLTGFMGRPTFCGPNFAVWRDAWERAGGFNTEWASAEDVNLSLKLARIGKVWFCPGIRVPSSARRTSQGLVSVFWHSAANYVRVTWLRREPLPFENFR